MHWMALLGENSLFKAIGDIFHPLFIAVSAVLAFIYGIVPNYAVAIILLTILIMALLTPLTIKSTRSMVAMQSLQPELQKLRQKYKGAENREQLNREMMALYKEHGVSPTGGCLPMFLQMPALIVLYDVIRGISNTVNKGQLYPAGTVYKHGSGTLVAGAHTVCNAANGMVNNVCAVPRYIPTGSRMYHDLIATPGVLKAFGLNLASKPLSHHAFWYDYIPYFIFVAVAVALQYIQMSQMTKRNKAAAQMNPQMQTMQKIMPLIFAYIYFIVPVGVVLYMIVSSAIRILTQDLIFRHGLVQQPGERRIGGTTPKKGTGGTIAALGRPRPELPKSGETGGTGGAAASGKGSGNDKGSGNGKPAGGTTGPPRGQGQAGGGQRTPGTKPPPQRRPSAGGRGGNGAKPAPGRNGAPGKGDADAAPKPHPRSKSKRDRKAR